MACKFCGALLQAPGADMCNGCYEVDKRVDDFVTSRGGRSRVNAALLKAGPEQGLDDTLLLHAELVWENWNSRPEFEPFFALPLKALEWVPGRAVTARCFFERARAEEAAPAIDRLRELIMNSGTVACITQAMPVEET